MVSAGICALRRRGLLRFLNRDLFLYRTAGPLKRNAETKKKPTPSLAWFLSSQRSLWYQVSSKKIKSSTSSRLDNAVLRNQTPPFFCCQISITHPCRFCKRNFCQNRQTLRSLFVHSASALPAREKSLKNTDFQGKPGGSLCIFSLAITKVP